MLAPQDRRRHPRTPVSLLIQHQADAAAEHEVDYATDLSPGGLFIQTQRTTHTGATLQVQFSPSRDSQLVQAYCRVTRVTPMGMGAAFTQLDPDSAQVIARALA